MKKVCFYILLIFLITLSNLGLCQDVITMVYRPTEKVPYIEDALSLTITIEPKGGNKKGSLENAVAQILLVKDN